MVQGLAALSMARLAERLGCGTMSLYRHVASKDELVFFMLATAPGSPPRTLDSGNWRTALTEWAGVLWAVYQRHPWILDAAAAGPPLDPGQLAWLEADRSGYRAPVRQAIDPARFPAIAAALTGGAFDGTEDVLAGVQRVLDGMEARARRS